jgi:hypothetical protein
MRDTSTIGKVLRFGTAAMLVAGALGVAAPSEAATLKRLFAVLGASSPGCTMSAAGELYFANARGTNSSGTTLCETSSNGSTSQILCNNAAVWHTVELGRLQSAGLMTVLSGFVGFQTTWTNFKSTPAIGVPSHATCPAGSTLTATSFGKTYVLP